jgi:hypothetical protein
MNESTSKPLPLYKCHKHVRALKIKAVTKAAPPTIEKLEQILNSEDDMPVKILPSGEIEVTGEREEIVVGALIEPEDTSYPAFSVSRAFVFKHNPQPGGYYVVYEDGYESYSPAKAFEEGYTKI